jgi:hypothetical protein
MHHQKSAEEKKKFEVTKLRIELRTLSVLRTRDNQLHHPAACERLDQ